MNNRFDFVCVERILEQSIYDVAREARVSVFTVSAVINNKGGVSATLARRVEAAIRKLNYRPNLLARSLAKQQTHTIGMIVTDIANPFFPAIVRAAEDAAQKSGYTVLLCNSDDKQEKEARYLELLLSRRVDGIILNKTPGKLSPVQRQMLSDARVPVVLLMRTCPGLRADLVQTDDKQGAMEAVSHLARLGRKTIAGLALLPRGPYAVLVTNYLMTVGFMRAADEMGMRCPEDFALVSFDDYPWLGCFRPRLTTIELPKYELGATAVRLLLELVESKRTRAKTVTLQPQLRVRESCGFMLRSIKAAVTA